MRWLGLTRRWRSYLHYLTSAVRDLEEFKAYIGRHNLSFLRIALTRELIPLEYSDRIYQSDLLGGTVEGRKQRKKILAHADATFQRTVVERDQVCRLCGTPEGLSAHHLVRRKHLLTRHDPRNGVALCWKCHTGVHDNPGLDLDAWLACESDGALFTGRDWFRYRARAQHGSRSLETE